MSDSVFYKFWDFDNNAVITYRRDGECNGCGACCMTLIMFNFDYNDVPLPNSGMKWRPHNGNITLHDSGQWVEVSVGDKKRYFQLTKIYPDRAEPPCSALTADKRCRLHAGKPLFHRAWPMHPSQVSPFKDCSYQFVEIERHAIKEVADD